MENHQSAVQKIFPPFLPVHPVLLLVHSDRNSLNQRTQHVCESSHNLKQLLVYPCHANLPLAMEHLQFLTHVVLEKDLLNALGSEVIQIDFKV